MSFVIVIKWVSPFRGYWLWFVRSACLFFTLLIANVYILSQEYVIDYPEEKKISYLPSNRKCDMIIFVAGSFMERIWDFRHYRYAGVAEWQTHQTQNLT